jgi:hypothetical protein
VVALVEDAAEVDMSLGRARLAAGDVAQVGAGGERPAGAGDDHRADLVVLGHRTHGLEQLVAERAVPRVQRLGAVELDGGRGAFAVEVHGGHGGNLPAARAVNRS